MTRISELSTLITDSLLGLTSLFFAWAVFQLRLPASSAGLYFWVGMFFVLGISAFLGAVYHGFHDALGPKYQKKIAHATLYFSAGTSFLLSVAATVSVLSGLWQIIFFIPAIIKFGVTLGTLVYMDKFRYVIYDSAVSIAMVAFLYGFVWSGPGAAWIVGGTVVAAVGSAGQLWKVGVHPKYFNHNDLYHVMQMLAISCIYLGLRAAFAA